jgi:hypothetical protein
MLKAIIDFKFIQKKLEITLYYWMRLLRTHYQISNLKLIIENIPPLKNLFYFQNQNFSDKLLTISKDFQMVYEIKYNKFWNKFKKSNIFKVIVISR